MKWSAGSFYGIDLNIPEHELPEQEIQRGFLCFLQRFCQMTPSLFPPACFLITTAEPKGEYHGIRTFINTTGSSFVKNASMRPTDLELRRGVTHPVAIRRIELYERELSVSTTRTPDTVSCSTTLALRAISCENKC